VTPSGTKSPAWSRRANHPLPSSGGIAEYLIALLGDASYLNVAEIRVGNSIAKLR